jgi:hypothetical protein
MNASRGLSRRHFLEAGAAILALPRLESLAGPDRKPAPRRMVLVCTAFGLYGPSFFPDRAGRDYEPSEYLKILGDLRGDFSVFSGISHPEIGGDHASESCFLTGAKHPSGSNFRNSVSIDYLAARHVGNATRFPLLSLGTDDAFPLTHTSTGAGVPGLSRPSDIYARLFLAGKAGDVAQEVARLKRGESILDRMGDRLSALKPRLGVHDRDQLADYVESVRDMEKQLHAGEEWATRPKPAVTEPAPPDNLEKADFIGRAKTLFGLTRLALRTDSTRVVSIFIRGMDLRPPIPGVTQDHHGLSHHGKNPAKIEELRIVERAEMAAFRDFLASLRETKEPDGNLLQETQVLIGSNLGDASGHGTTNLPILLAGGGFKHGQHLAGDRKDNTPLGKLYVSMLRRFGLETDGFASASGGFSELDA